MRRLFRRFLGRMGPHDRSKLRSRAASSRADLKRSIRQQVSGWCHGLIRSFVWDRDQAPGLLTVTDGAAGDARRGDIEGAIILIYRYIAARQGRGDGCYHRFKAVASRLRGSYLKACNRRLFSEPAIMLLLAYDQRCRLSSTPQAGTFSIAPRAQGTGVLSPLRPWERS